MHWSSRLGLCAAALLGAPVLGQTADAPISCIYRGVDGPTLLMTREAPVTDAHRSAERTVLSVIEACTQRHGWSPQAAQLAFRYAAGLHFEERAGENLRPFGLDPAILVQIADQLTAEERASLLRGDHAAAYAIGLRLANSGAVDLEGLTVEETRRLGGIVAEGVGGVLVRRDAVEQFGNPR